MGRDPKLYSSARPNKEAFTTPSSILNALTAGPETCGGQDLESCVFDLSPKV